MTQPGTPGSQVPVTDLDGIARRLRDMEREIAMLKANTLGRNGITVNNADGDPLARIGDIDGSGRYAVIIYYPDGDIQMRAGQQDDGDVETVFWRSTGSRAFGISGPTGGYQFAAIYDRQSQPVLSDDTASGVGIGVPYIPWGQFQSNSAPTDVTASATFVTLQTALGSKMNPKIAMQILGKASDPTTAGEIRVIDEDGTQIGGTITVAAGAFQYYNIAPTALPGLFKESKSLNIQARVTAGAGTIGVRGISAEGRQS